MKLKKMLKDISPEITIGSLDININNITHDSRRVSKNSLFVCIKGFKTDGHLYINEAINNGATAILVEEEPDQYPEGPTYIKVNNTRRAMSYIAAAYYNYPLKKLKLIGVTGTNGKTTTTYLIKALLEQNGYKTGLIGTIHNIIGDKKLPAGRTTPKSLELYHLFNQMVKNNIKYVVMEVSSHALDLERVAGMEFDISVFTNISQDHLDYHKSIDNYLEVKSRLFQKTSKNGYCIVNLDDEYSNKIISASQGQVITYSQEKDNSDFRATQVRISPENVTFNVNNSSPKIKLNLSGSFNVYNALAAISVGKALKISDKVIQSGLAGISGVAGRFEVIKENQDFTTIIDYAHTPDGMKNVLQTVNELSKNRIIIVFGCGGDRDKTKRPIMGKIAARHGDYCILTSDNPRSESPEEIISEIEAGFKDINYKGKYKIIKDRKEAIFEAIKSAKANDIVIIFGKGHETYQVFADKTVHFDDREVAREAINYYFKGEDN